MPRGGARVGSGRKPKSGALALVHGSRDRGTRPGPVSDEVGVISVTSSVEVPIGLPEGQAAIWAELAPHALAQGTLTPETAMAFKDLCEAIVLKARMMAGIEANGLTYLKVTIDGSGSEHTEQKANPLLARHATMMQRVEAGLGRFRLIADGKDRRVTAPAKNLSPLEKLQAQAKSMKRG